MYLFEKQIYKDKTSSYKEFTLFLLIGRVWMDSAGVSLRRFPGCLGLTHQTKGMHMLLRESVRHE